MYISKVTLVNFRNFRNAFFLFKKGINTIIGENGSGKTNLFGAMRLLLDDTMYSWSYKLNEGDFSRQLDNWRGHWIIISIEFDEISADESIQSLFIHGTGVAEEKKVTKATYNLFFRPKLAIRTRLSELKKGDTAGMEAILNSLTIQDYETFFTGKSTADFNDPEVYKQLVGDFDQVAFPKEIDSSLYGVKIHHQLSVAKEISFTFIQALRDVVADFRSNRKNPLLNLLKWKSGEINEKDFAKITDKIAELNAGIEELQDVKDVRNDIHSTMKKAVGETYAVSSLSIRSGLPDEADKLLQALELFVGEPGETYEGAIHELSLGGANLVYLTLKLLEYHYAQAKLTLANFLIIEEPEAHIHTHIQKALFDKVNFPETQIIYSTHSTYISEVCNIENMNILARKNQYAKVFQPSTGLKKTEITRVQRYLDSVRNNVLFAKGVVLVEGDAEEILIPHMFKKVFGLSLDELGISLINIRSTGFENLAQLFHPKRLHRKCAIITDSDKSIIDTTENPGDTPAIQASKKKLLRSETIGKNRRLKLEALQKGNTYIKPFFSAYTFEVDFIKAGNAWEVEQIVDDIYTDPATVEKVGKELKSKVVSEYGLRMIQMAGQLGKGWFAILVSKEVFFRTSIPSYIIDALLFVKRDYSNSMLYDMMMYRVLESEKEDEKSYGEAKEHLKKFIQGKYNFEKTRDLYEKTFPNDAINYFLNSL